MPHPRSGGAARPALDPRSPRRAPVRAQRLPVRAQQVPGAGRHHRGVPRVRGASGSYPALRRRGRTHRLGRSAHRRDRRRARAPRAVSRVALRDLRRTPATRDSGHRSRAEGTSRLVRGARQAARGAAAADAHHLRPRDAPRGRRVLGHRELLPPSRRARAGSAPLHPARLLPRRLRRRPRRVARHRPAAPRPVRGRPLAQGHPRRAWVPPAVGARQPPVALRRVRRDGPPGRVPLGDAEPLRAGGLRPGGRADRAPDGPDRSGGHGAAHQGPDRRPHRRDPAACRSRPARPRHHAHQEDGGGPHRRTCSSSASGCATCTARSTRSSASRS